MSFLYFLAHKNPILIFRPKYAPLANRKIFLSNVVVFEYFQLFINIFELFQFIKTQFEKEKKGKILRQPLKLFSIFGLNL